MIRGFLRTVSLLAVLLSLGGDAWYGASDVEGLRADARYAAMLAPAVDAAPADPVAAGSTGAIRADAQTAIVQWAWAMRPGADPVPPHAERLPYHANPPPFRS